MRFYRVTWYALLLAFAACDREAPRVDAAKDSASTVPIRTDKTEYTLARDDRGWDTRIPFRFTNLAADTAYAVNCNGATSIALEKKESTGWRVVWAPITNGCLSAPITIPPGKTFDDSVALWGAPPGGNVGPEFADTVFEGTYRLVWWNLVFHYSTENVPFGDTIPVRYRASNEFSLRAR
jgi:hypothetical protein